MGGWGNSGSSGGGAAAPTPAPTTSAPGLSTVKSGAYGLSTEFAADNPVRMPSASDNALLTAARLRRQLLARSGRDSTNLVGTQVYGASFLGSAA